MTDKQSLDWELRRCKRHLYLDKRNQSGSWSALDKWILRLMLLAIAGIAAVTVIRSVL